MSDPILARLDAVDSWHDALDCRDALRAVLRLYPLDTRLRETIADALGVTERTTEV